MMMLFSETQDEKKKHWNFSLHVDTFAPMNNKSAPGYSVLP